MANRYYLPPSKTKEEQKKLIKYSVCAECGEFLTIWWDIDKKESYLACHRHNINHHEGIAKEYHQGKEK
jgi:hypothetical protein